MSENYQKIFLAEYQQLNKEQKQAVDTTEGPVMVIAGAGTGKTQTIALRIANILNKTQTNPNNILALTFTENAALNMRSRLLSIIGPDAYNLKISTFHSFCNSIIQDNPQQFLNSNKESKAITDVKKIQIIRQLIDQLPSTSSFRNIHSSYFFQKDIIKSIQDLKKENVSIEKFSQLIDMAISFSKIALPIIDSLNELRAAKKNQSTILSLIENLSKKDINIIYKNYLDYYFNLFNQNQISLSDLKREVKNFILKTEAQISKQQDLLIIYQNYQKQLREENLFDFEDMIIWVINKFKEDKNFLAEYQEQYQYILVDEFQDTNSSQMEIIDLLGQDQENPNIFVVGDDDQSIFRFQGAAIENIHDFYRKYQNSIKTISLKNNYRSHRLILESSESVIKRNQNRISSIINDLDKSLVSTQDFDPDPINLFTAQNNLQENYFIANKIKELIKSGVEAKEIVVLYRNNNDIEDLKPLLSFFKIPYLISGSINILDNLLIQQLIDLLRYFDNQENQSLLAKILSFEFLEINSLDLYKLFHYSRKEKTDLLELILNQEYLNKINITNDTKEKLIKFIENFTQLQKDRYNLSLIDFFNKVIRSFNFLNYILEKNNLNILNHLNSLYAYLKNELSLEKIDLSQWLKNLDTLIDNDIKINSSPLIDDLSQSVKLMTVHKSKGLEFEHVFLTKVISGKWDKSFNRNNIKLPLGLLKTELANTAIDQSLEEDRRLFYVALTRAKRQIYISYSQFNQNNKEQLPSIFVNEIDPKLIEKVKINLSLEKDSLQSFFTPKNSQLKSPDLKSYLKDYLANQYILSPTHLNSYLQCPFCFFLKNILRIPTPKSPSLAFGTSVHNSLTQLFTQLKEKGKLISVEEFISIFESELDKQLLSEKDLNYILQNNRQYLIDYYQHYQNTFNKNCLVEYDFRPFNPRLNNIPITGKIDKIEILNNKEANVVDFKTGSPDKAKILSEDGDYFRQLVFYKLLSQQVKNFPYQIKTGTLDFIQKSDRSGHFVKKEFTITDRHLKDLTELITKTHQKILNLEFTPSEQCSDYDKLHYLFDKYFK